MVYCFDRKEASFRNEIYSDYKQNRDEMPDSLEPQIPYIRKLVKALGIHSVDKNRFEADDLIGTLAKVYSKKGFHVSIISGDKDFAQLINSKVTMYDPMRKVTYNSKAVKEKWGVTPSQMIDYLSLVGDSVDNIPGVRGVGAKTAQKLLEEYKTLDNIYKNLKQIKGSLQEKLRDGKKDAKIAKKLVTINTNVNLSISSKDTLIKSFQPGLEPLLKELNFRSFRERLFPESSTSKQKKTKKEKASKSLEITEWTSKDFQNKLAPYDNLLAFKDQNNNIFFSVEKNKIFYFKGNFKSISPILYEKKVTWSGFDVKEIWKQLDVEEPVALKDFMLMAYVATSSSNTEFSKVYSDFLGKPFLENDDEASVEKIYKAHLELEQALIKKIKDLSQKKVLESLEIPLIPVLYRMEQEGILLDLNIFKNLKVSTEKDLRLLEKKIYKEAGQEFNIASPKQLSEVLFQSMGLPTIKKTKTGFSTNSDVLMKLAAQHPICEKLLEYRELSKLQSTYIKALPELADPKTQRLHTCFKQAVTTTGRLSSIQPNLQNIPVRTERGREIRKAFICSDKKILISIDYNQIELRILAHITGDQNLIQAFHDDFDVHQMTASQVFGIDLKKVTPEQRRVAKSVNFGIAYGQGAYGLSENLKIPRKQAQIIIDTYFKKFPSIKSYINTTIKKAYKDGFVETLFGRRRYLKELKSPNPALKKFGERAAVNAPMQGTASDLIKKAMIIMDGEVQAPLLLQVHDELLLSCPTSKAKDIAKQSQEIMENVVELDVPLKANICVGTNWKDLSAYN